MTAQLLQFPVPHARLAARRTGATDDEIDAVAASIQAIVDSIHEILAHENRERERIMEKVRDRT